VLPVPSPLIAAEEDTTRRAKTDVAYDPCIDFVFFLQKGISAPGNAKMYEHFGLTKENIVTKAMAL
jgi:hypothetical protein